MTGQELFNQAKSRFSGFNLPSWQECGEATINLYNFVASLAGNNLSGEQVFSQVQAAGLASDKPLVARSHRMQATYYFFAAVLRGE